MDFAALITTYPDYIGSNGRNEAEVVQAEENLGINFAQDYREYLLKLGLSCADCHEFTGITDIARLDVVTVTNEQRALCGEETCRWYVVEETGMDGIVIWQDSEGTVYATAPFQKPRKLADSLMEYFLN